MVPYSIFFIFSGKELGPKIPGSVNCIVELPRNELEVKAEDTTHTIPCLLLLPNSTQVLCTLSIPYSLHTNSIDPFSFFLCRWREPPRCDARHQPFLLEHFSLPLRRVPLSSNTHTNPNSTLHPSDSSLKLFFFFPFPRYSLFSTRSCS